MKRPVLLLLSLILIWNCSTSMPEWYRQRDDYYPAENYILAEGWGQTPEKAIENATINMARIFNVKVSVEENILKRYTSISNMKEFEEYYTEYSEETAKLITDQHLVNIRFEEPVYDKKSRTYFTISYIEIIPTARILMDRMKRIQDSMEYYVRMAAGNNDPLVKYHYYSSAWLFSAKNKMLQEQLDVLAPGIGMKPIYTFAELESQKNKAAENIKFKIRVNGDSNNRIKQALSTVVNDAGFSAAEDDANVNLNAKASMKKIDIDQDKLAFVAWEFQLKMDKMQSTTALSLMEEGSEGSTNYQNAQMHAYERIQKFIETEFQNKLNEYFDTMKK